MGAAVVHHLLDIAAVGQRPLHLLLQLRQGNGGQLDVKALQQLALVAHGRPEIKGPRPDLQDADIPKGAHHIAHCQKRRQPLLKGGIFQPAVAQIGERHAEAAQHLAGGKQAALAVPQAHAVLIGALVPGTPQQHRHVQLLGQPGADVLRAEIAVGDEQAVHMGLAEAAAHRRPICLIVEKALRIDACHVHKADAQLLQSLPRQLRIFHRRRRGKDIPARRHKTKGHLLHGIAPLQHE